MARGPRAGEGPGAHPAGPVDEVIQLGHHILAPAAGKCRGLGDHSSSRGHSGLGAGHGTHSREGDVSQTGTPPPLSHGLARSSASEGSTRLGPRPALGPTAPRTQARGRLPCWGPCCPLSPGEPGSVVWGRAAMALDGGETPGGRGRDPHCIAPVGGGGPPESPRAAAAPNGGFRVRRSPEGRPHLLGLSTATLEWTPRTCVAAPTLELRGEGVPVKRALGVPAPPGRGRETARGPPGPRPFL